MTRRLPPLTALRAFEAAARHLSFTAAADELGVTHGAVSRQVRGLEEHLGTALFLRFNRHIELSEAGAALLPSLRAAFDLMAAGIGQVAQAHGSAGGLPVSCLGTLTMRWLIPRLHRFQADHPEIEVRLSASDGPPDPLRDRFALAIRVGAPPWPKGYRVTPFLSEAFGPVGAPCLLARHPVRQPADLLALPVLHSVTRRSAWRDWSRVVAAANLGERDGQAFEHFYFMLEAATAGLGVAIAPRVLVEDDLAAGRLAAPLGFVASGLSYYVALPTARADRRAAAFRDWIVDEARGLA